MQIIMMTTISSVQFIDFVILEIVERHAGNGNTQNVAPALRRDHRCGIPMKQILNGSPAGIRN